MDFDRTALAHRIDLLMGLALQVHPSGLEAEEPRDVRGHLGLARRELRSLADHGDVEVDDGEAGPLHPRPSLLDEVRRVAALPLGRRVGKRLSDIWKPQRTHQRVEHRVEDGIAIRVTDRPDGMVEADPSKDERPPPPLRRLRLEAVEVVAVADPKVWERECSGGFGHASGSILTKRDAAVGAKSRSTTRFSADTTPSSRPVRPLAASAARPDSKKKHPMTRIKALSLVVALSALAGCYGPRGAIYPYTGNGYTYVSSEMNPVTITLIDTRTEEPFFKMEIPVGKQLTLNFLEGKGDDPVLRPDRMVYAIMDAGTATGRLTNQLTCPPQGSRRIVYDLREAPEAREAPPAYDERIDGVKGRPAWWTPQGGELPRERRFYE